MRRDGGWRGLPLVCPNLVATTTLSCCGTDCVVLCVGQGRSPARPAPPGPISCPLVENCAFERRSCVCVLSGTNSVTLLVSVLPSNASTSPSTRLRMSGTNSSFYFCTDGFLGSIFLEIGSGGVHGPERSRDLSATVRRSGAVHSGSPGQVGKPGLACPVLQGTDLRPPTYQTEDTRTTSV